jgi:hypothetical protein
MCHDNGRSRARNSTEQSPEENGIYGLELDRLSIGFRLLDSRDEVVCKRSKMTKIGWI